MPTPRVAVAIVPRERLSAGPETIESVIAHTPSDVDVVFVSIGRNPRRSQAIGRAAGRRVRVLHHAGWLSPNEARNLALAAVDAELVIFVDNDVLVKPGWVEAMVDCATSTGAWLVTPLTLKGRWHEAAIHTAGGVLRIVERDGQRVVEEIHGMARRRPDEVGDLERGRTQLAEFHCVLARRDALEKLGGFDEGLPGTREQVDLCLEVENAGGSVWFEPAAVVTYVPPPPLTLGDLPYFWVRWSETWMRRSLERFAEKHGVPVATGHERWVRRHRLLPLEPVFAALARAFGRARVDGGRDRIVSPVEVAVNRALVPSRSRSGEQ